MLFIPLLYVLGTKHLNPIFYDDDGGVLFFYNFSVSFDFYREKYLETVHCIDLVELSQIPLLLWHTCSHQSDRWCYDKAFYIFAIGHTGWISIFTQAILPFVILNYI